MISLIYNKISESLSKYAILLIMAFYLLIAVGSGLKGGALLGLIHIVLLTYLVIKPSMANLLMIYVVTFFCGNFKIINLGSTYYLDLTFFMTNIIILYMLISSKQINKLLFLLYTIFAVTSVLNYSDTDFNVLYFNFSNLNFFYIFAFLIYNVKSIDKTSANLIVSIILLNFFISLLQTLGINISVSSTTQQSSFLGLDFINRSGGISGNIFSNGTKILVGLFLLSKYFKFSSYNTFIKKKVYIYIFFILSFLIAALSQRIFFVGLLIILLLFFINRISIFFKWALFSIIIVFIVFNSNQIISNLDASNALKFFMWYSIFLDQVNNFNIIKFLFGHGIESSYAFLGSINFEELVSLYQIQNWDIVIEDGFYPHNIFIQLFYEYGLISFVLIFTLILKYLYTFVFAKKLTSEYILLFLMFLNYSFHNGLFGVMWLLVFLIYFQRKENRILQRKKHEIFSINVNI